MRIRPIAVFAPLVALVAVQASAQPPTIAQAREQARRAYRQALADAREFYQGRNRGAEQSDTVSRKIRIGRNGQVAIENVSGAISVTAGSGDEVTIDAVKRARGDRSQLGLVDVVIEDRPGRVDVRTVYQRGGFPDRFFRDNNVSVDYTVVVPDGASVDLKSISGEVKVTGVKGGVRVESISGAVTATGTPRVELAKTVSGAIELSGVTFDGDLTASSISGSIRANGLKARSFDVSTVSGEVQLRDATVERLNARSISGAIEYSGAIAKNGRYEVNAHSGGIRLTLAGSTGFELDATSFSGGIRSDFPLQVGGDQNPDIRTRGRRGPGDSIHATFGDGSAKLTLRSFSGSIVIGKR
jgi:DUF4097 and DUF4098 domain-containing protein YvlB